MEQLLTKFEVAQLDRDYCGYLGRFQIPEELVGRPVLIYWKRWSNKEDKAYAGHVRNEARVKNVSYTAEGVLVLYLDSDDFEYVAQGYGEPGSWSARRRTDQATADKWRQGRLSNNEMRALSPLVVVKFP